MRAYIDGTDLQDIDPVVGEFLARNGLYTKDRLGVASKVSFCGFVPLENELAVFFPKTVRDDLSPEDLKITARQLFKCLKKYYRLSGQDGQSIHEGDVSQIESDFNSLDYMTAMSEILADWISYGPYKSKEYSFKSSQSGRIDWKRTERKILAHHNSEGVKIFPNFIIRKRDYHSNDLIAQLQKWAVANADHYLGWLYSEGHNGNLFPDMAHYKNVIPCDADIALPYLKNALRQQFDQRKIRLIKLLIRLLSGRTAQKGNYRMGVKFFWPVWEQICKEICVDQLDEYFNTLPQPEYVSRKRLPKNYGAGISQRPDIVSIRKECAWVIDSKYYDMTRNQPGWSDIVKQLYYADMIADAGKWEKVQNAFVFPKPANDEVAEKVIIRKPSGEDSRYAPILCVYIDAIFALNAYAGEEESDDFVENLVTD